MWIPLFRGLVRPEGPTLEQQRPESDRTREYEKPKSPASSDGLRINALNARENESNREDRPDRPVEVQEINEQCGDSFSHWCHRSGLRFP